MFEKFFDYKMLVMPAIPVHLPPGKPRPASDTGLPVSSASFTEAQELLFQRGYEEEGNYCANYWHAAGRWFYAVSG